jgi:hypothetical protein
MATAARSLKVVQILRCVAVDLRLLTWREDGIDIGVGWLICASL